MPISKCPGDEIEISDFTGDFEVERLYSKKMIYLLAAGTGTFIIYKFVSLKVLLLANLITIFMNFICFTFNESIKYDIFFW